MVCIMPKVKRVRFEDRRLLQAYRITSMRSENPINQALTPGEIPVSQSLEMMSSRDHFTATLLRPPYYGHPDICIDLVDWRPKVWREPRCADLMRDSFPITENSSTKT